MKIKLRKIIFTSVFLIFAITLYTNIMAFRDGIVGLTKKNGNTIGCVCHDFKPNDSVFVNITGPSIVRANDTAIYILSIANGPALAGGCDISTSLGQVYVSSLDTSLKRIESFPGSGFELTHRMPKLFVNDTLKFTFKYVAPSVSNVIDTLFANGNSTNIDTTSENDRWNYADNFLITVTPKSDIANNSLEISSFKLLQNFPNPFNPETRINFELLKSANITLRIFDIEGRELAKLIDNKLLSQGSYSVTLNALQFNLTSGLYFYELSSDDFADVKKMLLVK